MELEITGLIHDTTSLETHKYGIILEEALQRKKIRVIVGGFEAQAIAVALEKMLPSRPLTHDLIISIVRNTNIEIKEIIIDYFDDAIFYSKLILKVGTIVFEIDSRTSDAIALAVKTKVPIYTLISTFEKAYEFYAYAKSEDLKVD